MELLTGKAYIRGVETETARPPGKGFRMPTSPMRLTYGDNQMPTARDIVNTTDNTTLPTGILEKIRSPVNSWCRQAERRTDSRKVPASDAPNYAMKV